MRYRVPNYKNTDRSLERSANSPHQRAAIKNRAFRVPARKYFHRKDFPSISLMPASMLPIHYMKWLSCSVKDKRKVHII